MTHDEILTRGLLIKVLLIYIVQGIIPPQPAYILFTTGRSQRIHPCKSKFPTAAWSGFDAQMLVVTDSAGVIYVAVLAVSSNPLCGDNFLS